MESSSINTSELERRAANMVSILENNGVDIAEDAFQEAVTHFSHWAPQEVFTKALAFGTGQRDISDIRPDDVVLT